MNDYDKRAALVMFALLLVYVAAVVWMGVENGTGCSMPFHWSAGA